MNALPGDSDIRAKYLRTMSAMQDFEFFTFQIDFIMKA